MPALSIPSFCTPLHALKEERHFGLVEGLALPNHRLARNPFQVRSLDPTHASLRSATSDHDYYFELLFAEERNAQSTLGVQLHTIAMSGLFHVRTELCNLLLIPSLAHHPKQTNG